MAFDLTDTFPTLLKAPITEAVIDIRVELPSSTTLRELADFALGLENRFTDRQERRSIETRVELQQGSPPRIVVPSNRPDGYLFTSHSELLVAQARLNGFTLSRLRPYHDGDTFIQQATELWRRYVLVARPTKVTRLAIRNVNRIEMAPGSELQQYVLTGPEIARALPQQMLDFFLRLVIPDAASGAVAVVTQTLGPRTPEDVTIPLIFDIDAFREIQLSPEGQEIWEALATLRTLKNRIFFRSLTVEALEAFR
jgi:uncharacterized protein (TIGR04255 family)